MKSVFGGSAVIAAALLSSSLIISATPSLGETLLSPFQQQKQEVVQTSREESRGSSVPSAPAGADGSSSKATVSGVVTEATDPAGMVGVNTDSSAAPVTAPAKYLATAYSLGGRTASGKRANRGLIAADPSLLPLGTRVRLEAGAYSGEYVVADTGGAVRGKKIDIWTSNPREAMRFGRRLVKLTVLSYGPRRILTRRYHRR